MKTSVVGYPRIGAQRELKFAAERYFRGDSGRRELESTAARLREEHLAAQKKIDFPSCNDFSFYDTTLDTAVLFSAVPERYRALGLDDLDTYFAMARGYQGEQGDVRALPMKKWFNTNYHYIVPELEDTTKLHLSGTKPFDELAEAVKLKVKNPKLVIEGPFTFLKLAKVNGSKNIQDFAAAASAAWRELVMRAGQAGAKWVQFDEPYLVRDLSADDIRLFKDLYRPILEVKGPMKILLQTYFGDVRDVYQDLVAMPFDGIGLDFIEGRRTLELIKEHGFPKDKLLFAGLVNGKNIWRNHYEKTLSILDTLKAAGAEVVLSTSCSLLHVPYTLENEPDLDSQYKRYFAFAKEKLTELTELAAIADSGDYGAQQAYQDNVALFAAGRDCTDEDVQKRVREIKDEDYVRQPPFAEREALQRRTFGLPLFPTTTIGSFPQTSDVKFARRDFRIGDITEQEYVNFTREKIAECVKLQEEIGLDVLVHGEYERNDMVEYFGQRLGGFLFTSKAWVQSYGTRCVKPPVVWGDVFRARPMTIRWSTYAQSLTQKPMKGMLTGPVTILNWSFPREDVPLKETTLQLALALRDEVLELERNGIRIIQIDEAALREKLPLRQSDWYSEYLDWAIPAFRLVHSGVKAETQIHTHMCYSEFTDIIPAIDNMDADVISFEASRSNLGILDSLKQSHFKTQVGPGVYDIHSPRVPPVEEIKETLHKIAEKVELSKIWVNPDCGLKTRGPVETKAALMNLVQAARELREEFKGQGGKDQTPGKKSKK